MRKFYTLGCAFAVLMATTLGAASETLHFVACGDGPSPVYGEAIKDWEDDNPDYSIMIEVIGWSHCQDDVAALAAAGTPADLAHIGSRALRQLARSDMIVPIPLSGDEKASYHPYVVDTVSFDGTQWGVPVAFSTKSLYWNKDLFARAGLDPEKPPTTWAEEIAYAKAIAEKTDAAGFGVVAKTSDNTMHQFLHWVYTNDGLVIDDNDNIVLDSKQNLEALTALRDIAAYAEEEPTAYEQNEVRATFLDGKLGMIHASFGAAVLLESAQFDWGVTTLPIGPSAKGPGTLLVSDAIAVFKGTGREEISTAFAKYMTSPKIQENYELEQGLTPIRPGPPVFALIASDHNWKPFIDGIAFGGPEPLLTDYRGMQNTIIDMVQAVVTGAAEPQAALTKAARALEEFK